MLNSSTNGAACAARVWKSFGCTADTAPLMQRWLTQSFLTVVNNIANTALSLNINDRKACYGAAEKAWPGAAGMGYRNLRGCPMNCAAECAQRGVCAAFSNLLCLHSFLTQCPSSGAAQHGMATSFALGNIVTSVAHHWVTVEAPLNTATLGAVARGLMGRFAPMVRDLGW